MAKEVQIPKGLLTALVAALAVSLLGTAYLLGKQSGSPAAAQSTPAPTPAPATLASNEVVPQAKEPTLSARLDRIEQRVDRTSARLQAPEQDARPADLPARTEAPKPSIPAPPPSEAPAVSPPPRVAQTSPNDLSQRRAYFQEVDSILPTTASIEDPNQFATKFLQQAMSGDTSGFDSLLSTTRKAQTSLQAVTPPPSCRQHHSLLLSQLSQSVVLLNEVNQAIASSDTSRLSAVAARGQEMQAETERFKQLDRELRRGL